MNDNFQLPQSVKDGRYEIRDYLGQGTMALVYLAWDTHMRREVAVKFLNNQVEEDVDNPDNPYLNFRREIDTLLELESCDNIVKILDYDLHHVPQYIVMDYMPGGTAEDKKSELLEFHPQERLEQVSQILDQIISALECSHQKSIVHRDIKPSNIFFDNRPRAHLGDFGIAKNLLFDSGFSKSGLILGPVKYMAPEAIEGDVTEQSDQYSLACVVFELLTGQTVFDADSLIELNRLIITKIPTRINETQAGQSYSTAIANVLEKALSKKPQDRYPSVRKFGDAFKTAIRMLELTESPTNIMNGRYKILEPIGAGGMGVVHLALDQRVNQTVAVKFLSIQKDEKNSGDLYERFQDEIDTLKKLNPYDYIVNILDYGNEGDVWFVIMEYMEGGDLYDRMLDYLKMGISQRLKKVSQLVQEISAALEKSHKNDIIHRDIKLRNILFNRRGEAHLADFGIAKNIQRDTQRTQAGMIVGTLNYMAPEAIENKVNKLSDQYSLACVVYEVLTGQRAFDGTTLVRLIHTISNDMPERINRTKYGRVYSDAVADVLEKAMSKHVMERYPTIRDFAQAFEDAARLHIETMPSEPESPPIIVAPDPTDSKTIPGTDTGGRRVVTDEHSPTNIVPTGQQQTPNHNLLIYGGGIVILLVVVLGSIFAFGGFGTTPITETPTTTLTATESPVDTATATDMPPEETSVIEVINTVSPTHMVSDTPSPTDMPTATNTASPTHTLSPTDTPTATNTPNPSPTEAPDVCATYGRVEASLANNSYTGLNCRLFHEFDTVVSDLALITDDASDAMDYLRDECDKTDSSITFSNQTTFLQNYRGDWTDFGEELCP